MNFDTHRLVRNQGFLSLQSELNKFNIFHATGMKHMEIKHTQFLGYILDPNESHGFKDEFLLRFLQLLPESIKIQILDFNLSYAKIIKEKTFNRINSKKRDQIDLIIEIPSLSIAEKVYVVVIENKIRASEGDGQLARYKKALSGYYREQVELILLYLTMQFDEPSDEDWVPIRYSEVVIPAVKGLVSDLDETMSDYIRFILNDYIEFINEEGGYEVNGRLDDIANSIDDSTLEGVKWLTKKNKDHTVLERRALIRYGKPINFLGGYDVDPRKQILKEFKSIFAGGVKQEGGVIFKLESSNRSWMRFSFLNEENGEKFSEICKNPTRKWLESGRNLAFELIFDQPEGKKVNCRVSLILGPTGVDYKYRGELLSTIRAIFKEVHKDESVSGNEAADHFDAIKRGAYSSYKSDAPLAVENAKEWMRTTIENLARNESQFIEEVNNKLRDFFNKEPSGAEE